MVGEVVEVVEVDGGGWWWRLVEVSGGGGLWRLVRIDCDQNRKTALVLGKYKYDFEYTKELTVAKTAKPQQIYRSI